MVGEKGSDLEALVRMMQWKRENPSAYEDFMEELKGFYRDHNNMLLALQEEFRQKLQSGQEQESG